MSTPVDRTKRRLPHNFGFEYEDNRPPKFQADRQYRDYANIYVAQDLLDDFDEPEPVRSSSSVPLLALADRPYMDEAEDESGGVHPLFDDFDEMDEPEPVRSSSSGTTPFRTRNMPLPGWIRAPPTEAQGTNLMRQKRPSKFLSWETDQAIGLSRADRYGPGTWNDVRNKYFKAEADGNLAASTWYAQRLHNRLQDGFTGRGAYRKRGRGMYTAGVVRGRGAYRRKRLRGRGSFWGDVRRGAEGVRRGVVSGARFLRKHQDNFYTAAGAAASLMGRPDIGMQIAGSRGDVGALLGAVGGRGAYNTLFPELGPEPIAFESTEMEHGNLIVSGSEKVFDVFGNEAGTPFSSIAIPLFPGNFQHFPKLAQHAADFKEYEWVQLIFIYKTNIASNWSTETITTGKVIMATQMDVNRPVWTTYDELAAQENKTEGLITGLNQEDRMHVHGVECDPNLLTSKGLKFVRTKGLTGKADLTDYDLGRFQFGMFGTGPELANAMIGELWVQYRVAFKNHRQYSMLGYNIPTATFKKEQQVAWNKSLVSSDVNQRVIDTTNMWKETYQFEEKCDFNNIDIKIDVLNTSDYTLPRKPPGYQAQLGNVYGIQVRLTFSSSLKGDFEIKIGHHGEGLIPSDLSSNPNPGHYPSGSTSYANLQPPICTGTAFLNQDIPFGVSLLSPQEVSSSVSTNNASAIDTSRYDTSQRGYVYQIDPTLTMLTVHVHVGQAISTIDNSILLNIPFISSINSPLSNALNGENDGDAGPYSSKVFGNSFLEVRMYNAQQLMGSAGMPYSEIE